jgi:ankyrin repeat protein
VESDARPDDDPHALKGATADGWLRALCRGRDVDGRPLLDRRLVIDDVWLAAAAGRIDRLADLLAADPEAAGRRGGPFDWPPVCYAAASRIHREHSDAGVALNKVVRHLLANGGWPVDGAPSPVELVCEFGRSTEVIEILIQHAVAFDHGRALRAAAREPGAACLRRLLRAGVEPASTGVLGVRLESEDLDTLDHLLAAGCDPNEYAPPHGRALHRAVVCGRSQATIERLVRAGADVDAPGELGLSPARLAHRLGRTIQYDALVALGADPRLSSIDVVLGFGARGLETAALDLVAREPSLIPAVDDPANPLLQDLAADGVGTGVRALLAMGLPANARPRGTTALHAAASRARAHVVPALLQHGARVEALDQDGRTPLALLVKSANTLPEDDLDEFVTTARILVNAGAHVDVALAGACESPTLRALLQRAARRFAA